MPPCLTPDHILAKLAGILREIDLEPNTEIIKQGNLGDCMFVIAHGAVKVHRDGEVLATLGPRDIVGEMSVLDPEPRSASVTTTAATHPHHACRSACAAETPVSRGSALGPSLRPDGLRHTWVAVPSAGASP